MPQALCLLHLHDCRVDNIAAPPPSNTPSPDPFLLCRDRLVEGVLAVFVVQGLTCTVALEFLVLPVLVGKNNDVFGDVVPQIDDRE